MLTHTNPFRTIAIAGAVLVAGFARAAHAVEIVDDQVQIDERAAQIVQAANSLCWEMYRYHQQKPDYPQSYRAAKDLWRQAGLLRDTLQNGPFETETLLQQVSQMNDLFVRLDQDLAKWGDGDRSALAANGVPNPRTIVTDGVVVDIPFVGGFQVGGPRVAVIDDDTPALQRRRLHANSRGSKRSLEREVASLKLAMSYLLEDAGISGDPTPPAPGVTPASPVPQPPEEANLGKPVKVVPRGAK